MSSSDYPFYGDRRVDRRIGAERRAKLRERRRSYPGSGRDARKGHCRECGAQTDAVVVWNGKATNLCAECGEKIRGGE